MRDEFWKNRICNKVAYTWFIQILLYFLTTLPYLSYIVTSLWYSHSYSPLCGAARKRVGVIWTQGTGWKRNNGFEAVICRREPSQPGKGRAKKWRRDLARASLQVVVWSASLVRGSVCVWGEVRKVWGHYRRELPQTRGRLTTPRRKKQFWSPAVATIIGVCDNSAAVDRQPLYYVATCGSVHYLLMYIQKCAEQYNYICTKSRNHFGSGNFHSWKALYSQFIIFTQYIP